MADQTAVGDQPGYAGVLQRELEGLVGSSSVSRVSRSTPRETEYITVSNAVPNGMKLH